MKAPTRLPGLFIAGTDTGVGKTHVAAALLRLAARRGRRVHPFKPAETGCAGAPPSDATRLREAANRTDLPLHEICPYAFDPPVAPAAAANPPLTLARLTSLPASASHADALLIESAGGLLTPYAIDVLGADLAAALALPILLVARNGLGTINHTLLAVAELRRRELEPSGVVLVDTTPSWTADRAANRQLIEEIGGVRVRGILPHVASEAVDDLADAAAAALNLDGLPLP